MWYRIHWKILPGMWNKDPMTSFDAEYRLILDGESPEERGSCSYVVDERGITLNPRGGIPVLIGFAEVASWKAEDYELIHLLADGTRLHVFKLARRFDECVSCLSEARRKHFAKSLLLEENGAPDEERGYYERKNAAGELLGSGRCSVHLQSTSLACFPDVELPFLEPYGAICATSPDDDQYHYLLSMDDGDQVLLHHFAKRTDQLIAGIETRRSALAHRQSEALAALSPESGAMVLRKAAQLLRDGVPVERGQLETAAPGLWDSLWRSGFLEDRREYAEILLNQASSVFVVIKETGAWGAPEDTPSALINRRLLFLFHIGQTVVAEAPSTDDTATYTFSISGDVTSFTRKLCRAFAAIQFRREPIYLPSTSMNTPPHDRYAEACRLLPELILARNAFTGRIIHTSPASWQQELTRILSLTT